MGWNGRNECTWTHQHCEDVWECAWTHIEKNLWDTECRYTFKFGSPLDNGFGFCPYCGKKLVVALRMTREEVKEHTRVQESDNVFWLPKKK